METKDKTLSWLCTTTREINQHCSGSFLLAHTTAAKASTPSSSIRDLRVEKPKVQTPKITIPQYTNDVKTFEKTRKEKKKSQQN